jgi:thiamine biosynthesis lipoprotein
MPLLKTFMQRYLCSMLVLLFSQQAAADWHSQEAAIMGTNVTVELWHEDAGQAQELAGAVLDEMRRIDELMSTHKPDSLISRVNRNATTTPVPVTEELLLLLTLSLEYSELTAGAFDITYASAGQHYDYRKGKFPDSEQLAESLPAIDYRHVRLNHADASVSFLRKGVRIDLGGIAKGYAVDRGIGILQQAGIRNALVSAGGDTRVIGKRRDHPWNVGIRDPRRPDKIVSLIPLEDAAISTSGDYERFFEKDGVRYHHILNPGTGKSSRGVHSTSIIGQTSINTDALSTSVFVLGVKKGLQLINSIDDTEAVIVDDQGRLHYSNGLERIAQN